MAATFKMAAFIYGFVRNCSDCCVHHEIILKIHGISSFKKVRFIKRYKFNMATKFQNGFLQVMISGQVRELFTTKTYLLIIVTPLYMFTL